jgi:hypothetical protein
MSFSRAYGIAVMAMYVYAIADPSVRLLNGACVKRNRS